MAELQALGESDEPFICCDRCEMRISPFSCIMKNSDINENLVIHHTLPTGDTSMIDSAAKTNNCNLHKKAYL